MSEMDPARRWPYYPWVKAHIEVFGKEVMLYADEDAEDIRTDPLIALSYVWLPAGGIEK
jgi:hypothetical protein